PELQAQFLGADTVSQQLSQPIDQMVAQGGGIGPSIAAGERYVREYQQTLADRDAQRAQLRAEGQTDQWIDTYFLTVQDGITINQAFVDAVRCRLANPAQEKRKLTPVENVRS